MIEDVEREKRWIPIQSDYKKFVAEQEKYNTTKIPEIGATLPKSTPQSQAPTPPPTPQQPPLQQKEQKEPQKVAAMNREVSERLKTELQKAVPSWAKDGLGLKGSEASKVQRSVRTEQQTRLPTVSELRDGNEESIPGTIVSLKPTRISDKSEQETHPFKISVTPELNNGQITGYKATVSPGVINNILPSNIITSANELATFDYGANQTRHVVLTASNNQAVFTSSTIALEDSAPPAVSPTLFSLPPQVKILIGVVYNETVFQIVRDNISLSGQLAFYRDRTSVSAGQIAYEAFFTWA